MINHMHGCMIMNLNFYASYSWIDATFETKFVFVRKAGLLMS